MNPNPLKDRIQDIVESGQRSGTRKVEALVEEIYRAFNKQFAIPVEDVRKAVEDELNREEL